MHINKFLSVTIAMNSLVMVSVIFSCSKNPEKKIRNVLEHFKDDQEKYFAAKFLIDNIENKYCIQTNYLSSELNDYTFFLSHYNGHLSPSAVRDSLSVSKILTKINDSDEIDSDFLIENINTAFEVYENPIGKTTKWYSRDIFLNYVLPYRVGFEKLNRWRTYMRKRYTSYLTSFHIKNMSVRQICQNIRREQDGTNKYASYWVSNITPPSINQTIDEILDIRIPFSCEDYAIRSLYVLRSLGIPSSYERIPYWGKFNYGHAQESVLFENGKFYPNVEGDTVPYKYQIAKMYRRTFKTQENPTNRILALGEKLEDIPDVFDFENYIDITNERTEVSDINLQSDDFSNKRVLYICVYNGGEWKPIEWAKVDKNPSKVCFSNMGRKILYHISYTESSETHLLGSPIILDINGNIKLLVDSNKITLRDMRLTHFDRNKTIELNKAYSLYIWKNEAHEWRLIGNIIAKGKGLIFHQVPVGLLFKLEPADSIINQPVRPFTWNNNGQLWW